MMTVGTGGFSGSAADTGPVAGFDPILGKFRRNLKKSRKKRKKAVKESAATFSTASTPHPSNVIKGKVTGQSGTTKNAGGKILRRESTEYPGQPSRLFQYKVTIPEVGETIIYASSLAELTQKMRLLVNPRYRADINIERVMPAEAAKFFMDKRVKHMKNIK